MVKKSGVAARRSRSPAARSWTTNPALQAYLTQLVALAEAGDREAFARVFVPLDLTEEDLMGYVTDLRQNEQQWAHVRRAHLTPSSAVSAPCHLVTRSDACSAARLRIGHDRLRR